MLNPVQTISSSINPSDMEPQKKSNKSSISWLFKIALIFFIFSMGYRLGEIQSLKSSPLERLIPSVKSSETSKPSTKEQSKLDQNDKDVNFNLYWEAWELFDKNFVDRTKLETKKMFYNSIKGMVQAGEDPYTFFLTPDENQQSKDSLGGKFEGIGAQLGTKDGRIVVIAPIKNSPALRAGILAGDVILKVDGKDVKGQNITQVVSIIRGPAGTKVVLTIERKSKEQEIAIIRSEIKVEAIETTYTDKIAHVKLQQFGTTVKAEWDKTADELKQKYANGEIKGMILDLRSNPGGLLDACVYISSDFLPRGSLVVKQVGINETIEYKATNQSRLPEIPVVVLIDKGSASASEILAGALQDHKRAKLVGEKSFGKGSVQGTYDLSDGSGMHVTVAKWILPDGNWIHGKGIEPDVKVENPEGDIKNTVDLEKNDKQLQKAMEMLK